MNESLYLPDFVLGLTLEAGPRGLRVIRFGARVLPDKPGPIVKRAERQLREYAAGERGEFDLPLDMEGSEFQIEVWQALRKIPYGETRSYADIAHDVDRAKAVRALGAANGANPVAVIVPCHRVIGKDGSLTGYSAGGLSVKAELLRLETMKERVAR